MSRCVEEYVAGLEALDGVSDIEAVEDVAQEEGRAFSTTAFIEVDGGQEQEGIRYTECRWLGDGVTVVVLHTAPAGAYDDETELREELLEGLKAP